MSLFTQAMARFTATGSQPIIAFGPEIDANNTLHRLITVNINNFFAIVNICYYLFTILV